jgi:hypothetical protein
LINIWIPHATSGTPTPTAMPAAGATQVNNSTATGSATNTNQVTQTAKQTQEAGGASPTHGPIQVGGGQSQVVTQSAPTTQVANADAASTQTGATNLGQQTNVSSATALANNENQIDQSAEQIQAGGVGGSQSQVIEQSAPVTQTATATATSHQSGARNSGKHGGAQQTNTSTATATTGGANHASQTAQQAQSGGGSQSQVVEQDAPTGGATDAHADSIQKPAMRTQKPSWVAATSAELVPALSSYFKSRIARWARPAADTRAGSKPRPARRPDARAPKDERLPLPPQSPTSLGAAPSGAAVGSLWIFAALLIPFALTAPWWARRYGPSGFRRLMGVVVRLERPG